MRGRGKDELVRKGRGLAEYSNLEMFRMKTKDRRNIPLMRGLWSL